MCKDILKDYKVVELASVLAGPLVGSFCAELGAKVIKIENSKTNGDVTRKWKLPQEDPDTNISAYYASANYNKDVIMLDLKKQEDYNKLISEIADADIIISNYQKQTAKSLMIDFDTLMALNPSLIFVQLNAFDYDDPRPGYDLVMQAETGYISMCGTTGGELAKMPVALIDVLAAHQMKEALLLAMINKLKTNKGAVVHISLYKSGISALANQAANYLSAGCVPQPMGTLHPNIAPYGDLFRCSDGTVFMLAVGSDEQFGNLGKTLSLDVESLLYFCSNQNRVLDRSKLCKVLSDKFQDIDWESLKLKFEKYKIPYCVIKDLSMVFEDKQAMKMVKRHMGDMAYISNIAFNINEN